MPAFDDPYPNFVPHEIAYADQVDARISVLYGALAGNLDDENLANGAVTTPILADEAVTDDKLGDELSGSHFSDDGIPGVKVAGVARDVSGKTVVFAIGSGTVSFAADDVSNAVHVTHGLEFPTGTDVVPTAVFLGERVGTVPAGSTDADEGNASLGVVYEGADVPSTTQFTVRGTSATTITKDIPFSWLAVYVEP